MESLFCLCIADTSTVVQLTGLDAVQLIAKIVEATSNARMHKKNCQDFADYVKIIGDLLEDLDIADLKTYPATKAPLERLERALRRSTILVTDCRDRHFVYLLVMGWNIAEKFRRAEMEIERYLNLIPLITLVQIRRVRAIRMRTEGVQPEHTSDEEDEMQDALSDPGWLSRMEISYEMGALEKNDDASFSFRDEHEFSCVEECGEVDMGISKSSLERQNDWSFAALSLEMEKKKKRRIGFRAKAAFPRMFQLSELKSATDNFARKNIVGRGEFTVVYRGWIFLHSLIAVKKWKQDTKQGSWELKREKNVLGNVSHPNLIKLLGYCNEGNKILLVYEFMPNGSLEHHLLGGGKPLSWEQRMKIAIGAARCLEFLHKSEKHIIHGGVKPSVILLDSDFNTKLSGLGLSRDGPTAGEPDVSMEVLGTPGYLDPHYVETGCLDAKADVYALGIVLLQMLSAKKVFDFDRPRGKAHLIYFAEPYLSGHEQLAGLMDPRLEGLYPPEAALQLAQLSLRCAHSDRKIRPSMKEVVEALEKIKAIAHEKEEEEVETTLAQSEIIMEGVDEEVGTTLAQSEIIMEGVDGEVGTTLEQIETINEDENGVKTCP